MTDGGKLPHYLWQRIIGEPGSNVVESGESVAAQSSGNAKLDKRKRLAEPPHKGDGCRSETQRQQYPEGRTRLTQLIARTPLQGTILTWILSHTRSRRGTSDTSQTRQTALWRLLEAGWKSLCGDQPVPHSLDHGATAVRHPQGDGRNSSSPDLETLASEESLS